MFGLSELVKCSSLKVAGVHAHLTSLFISFHTFDFIFLTCRYAQLQCGRLKYFFSCAVPASCNNLFPDDGRVVSRRRLVSPHRKNAVIEVS